MSQGTELLDQALAVAQQEKTALENGAYEEAIELARKRTSLTDMAWNFFTNPEKGSYHKKLMELSSLQQTLTDIATRAHDSIRQKLQRSRQEKKRIRGYHMAVGQALQ